MSLPPLTHHEILGLVEPFTRRGRRVDLDASDRIARRLVFKPVERPAAEAGAPDPPDLPALPTLPTLREELELEHLFARLFRLTRVLTPARGLPARLVAEGPDPGELLALVEAIAPERQLRLGDGFAVAHHQQVEPAGEGQAPRLLLTESTARAGGLTLTLRMPTVKRRPAELELNAEAGDAIALPEDLLAVLGWDWAPLKRVDDGQWKSKLRVRGADVARSRRVEAQVDRAARHLARTLAEAPRRFHERFVAARWGAAARRLIPVLTALGVVAIAVLIPADYVKERPGLRLLLMNAPLLLIGLSFTLQEMSRIELPPLPRPAAATAWRPAAQAPQAGTLEARAGGS